MKQESGNSRIWQRDLVLMAKNIYVWLFQLSQKYSCAIHTLDQIPAEELQEIRNFGITGLWLVGIWERSQASRRIKQLYGHGHLLGSAYSVNGYQVANDLGGESALDLLKAKAAAEGIFIACDMVPNHTGVDSPWVLDHPDWYISTLKKPVSTWEYNSEDLSPREGVQIRLEDGYYTQQEAAEVFQYTTSEGFGPLFIYHGNDGTSMPWNDTAQLDYLNPHVREEVKRQILEVARRFPIIRLDAAMTLIKQHFKRLWYPDPGGEKFIPTRDAFPMSQEEFDARMPYEFWAEVLKELKLAAPDNLMLAEAFWLMEKYFVRELGMHRVYNSAFLNQLRDEENSQLRRYFREILETDPTLLECFVNYLTTPDEAPAKEIFGSGDKYFGVCGFMSALPGLPMFGHGQIEGLTEHYGMDFQAPLLNEQPDEIFKEKHKRWITPLLRQRPRFSHAEKMSIFDLQENGRINEDVFIFSNLSEGYRSLVIFNNSNHAAGGRIHYRTYSANRAEASDGNSLDFALELVGLDSIQLTELRTGEKRFIDCESLRSSGLELSVSPYQLLVYSID
jgi:glycosidase